MSTCPSAVLQWKKYAIHWGRQTGLHPALILAIIDQESGGNAKAKRAEPEYLNKLLHTDAGRKKIMKICDTTDLDMQGVVTSYGLMQPLFTLAYGYGARSVDELYDPSKNIRYCSAHLANLMKKHNGSIRRAAGAYNGAGADSKYARDVEKLYAKYKNELEGSVLR